MKEKVGNNKKMYLIKWKYYPNPADYTWEPANKVKEVAPDLVHEWNKN